jgi:hypothetical protein
MTTVRSGSVLIVSLLALLALGGVVVLMGLTILATV